MSPEGSEIANEGPSTSVTETPSPLSRALALVVHGCDTEPHATALVRRRRSYARDCEDRADRATVVHGAAAQLWRNRARGRAPHRRSRRARLRRHIVREWR